MRYQFADCELDTRICAIRRGKVQRTLRPKPFQVLLYLLKQRERVVSKQELAEQLWPDQFVSDAVIENTVLAARRAAGDSGHSQHVIQTLRGHGYRFVAALTFIPGEGATAGAPAIETVPEEESQIASHHLPLPELPRVVRRQLSVLCCDLTGVDGLSRQLEPEDYLDMLQAYHMACAEIMQRFEGHISQTLGERLLVHFGHPQAHEDDVQRAVYAGLELLNIVDRLQDYLPTAHRRQLAIRASIHTGLVVLQDLDTTSSQQLTLGETPRIATRLLDVAAPNSVVISGKTYHLVSGHVTCRALGVQHLYGLAEPLEAYQVLAANKVVSRFAVRITHGLTPLVGRQHEMAQLLVCWSQTRKGAGGVILISGEAGIGKSRLIQALGDHIASEPHTQWICQSSPHRQHTAFWPIMRLLTRLLQWHRDDPETIKLQKLEAIVTRVRLPLDEAVPVIATLLMLPLPVDRYPPQTQTPQRQRQKTFEMLRSFMPGLASQQPALLIVEDLHWMDPSTLEFLELLVDQGPMAGLLIVVTCRPMEPLPWFMRAHVSHLTVGRLAPDHVDQMICQVEGGQALPEAVRQQIAAATDGVPLFIEEVTRMLLDARGQCEHAPHAVGPGRPPAMTIPATLHDLLMARLDQMGASKAVAQIGAVVGRTFSYPLLQHIAALDDVTLQFNLRRLVTAELLYQQGVPPQATYTFKHALIQDAAYQSLLKRTQRQLHRQTAQVIAAYLPAIAEAEPEVLAYHCTQAGLIEQAIYYWHKASQQASARCAYTEATAHLTQALSLLENVPAGVKRTRLEFTLQHALGLALMATKGQANEEVGRTYTRARDLCQQMGEPPQQLFGALWGLLSFYVVRAELRAAWEVGERLFDLAQRQHDTTRLIVSHWALGQTLLFLGEFAPARDHLEQGITLYDPEQRHAMDVHSGFPGDLGVFCFCFVSHALWQLGYPDLARQRIHQALTLAEQLAHPYSRALALDYAAMLYQFRREGDMSHASAEAAITLCREHGFAYYLAWGTIIQGWALAAQGQREMGIAQMNHSLTAIEGTGAKLRQPYYLALLSAAHSQAGQVEEGLILLADALAGAHKTEERWSETESYRLQGELLLQQSPDNYTEAETCFHQALDIARRQQAKSWELRAATSLARLWQSQGKRQDAYDLLAPVYGWFTEGFDTTDLKDARVLLEELG